MENGSGTQPPFSEAVVKFETNLPLLKTNIVDHQTPKGQAKNYIFLHFVAAIEKHYLPVHGVRSY